MSQRDQAVIRLRDMILNGDLRPGQRLAEATLAERLGLSRTPVRQALPVLAQEGLVISHVTRGYIVRDFSKQELFDAVDLRGVLEGVAARTLAERGAPKSLLRGLNQCLQDGDAIFAKGCLAPEDEEAYGAMNARFHALIVEGCGRAILIDTVARLQTLPFVAPRAIAFGRSNLGRAYPLLHYAHRQHHAVTGAIERGEGMRAQALMTEHAQPQKDSMELLDQAAPFGEGALYAG